MKKIFLILFLMALTFEASSAKAGWWDHQPSQHEQQLEQQLTQEQQHSNSLSSVIVILGIGCFATLIVGTMIGSKCRKASNENK